MNFKEWSKTNETNVPPVGENQDSSMTHSRKGFEQLDAKHVAASKKDRAIDDKIETSGDLGRPLQKIIAELEKKIRSVLEQDSKTTNQRLQEYKGLGHEEAIKLNAQYDELQQKLQRGIEWAHWVSLGDNDSRISEKEMEKSISEWELVYRQFLELRAQLNERPVAEEKKYPNEHNWRPHGKHIDLDTGDRK